MYTSCGEAEERLEAAAASGVVEEEVRGSPGSSENAKEVRTGELRGEVQWRSGGAFGTHRTLELWLSVMVENSEGSEQPGGPNSRRERERKERRARGTYRQGLDGI
jgi:hypothetical protein